MHVNTQVRNAARDALVLTSLQSVFTNRGADLKDAQLPAGVIGTGADVVEEQSKDGLEQRTITLTVVVVVNGDVATVDDDVDAARVEIERELPAALEPLAKVVEHTGADLDMGFDDDGQRWYAFLTLSWRVEVWTQTGDPETAL